MSVVRGNGDACPGAGGGANRPPSITTSAVTSAAVGQTYTYDVNATDADNDPLPGRAPDKGTLSGPNPDGSFTYVAPSGPAGQPFQPVVRYKTRMDGGYLGHYKGGRHR